MGVSYSWPGGKAGLGCSGDGMPIDFGISSPTPSVRGFVNGHVNGGRALSLRINSADGSTKTVPLIHRYFLTELAATTNPVNLQALDTNNTVIGTKNVNPVVGMPTE